MREDSSLHERELREQMPALERDTLQVEVQLLQVRAASARLEGELKAYSLGRETPINVGLLLASAMVFGVVLVFVVAQLIG